MPKTAADLRAIAEQLRLPEDVQGLLQKCSDRAARAMQHDDGEVRAAGYALSELIGYAQGMSVRVKELESIVERDKGIKDSLQKSWDAEAERAEKAEARCKELETALRHTHFDIDDEYAFTRGDVIRRMDERISALTQKETR